MQQSAPRRQTRPDLTEDTSVAQALRVVADGCLNDFSHYLDRVMSGDDPEGPHGARVALRRLRSALAGFRPVLRHRASRPVAREARALFRLLGRQRDADVVVQAAKGAQAAALEKRATKLRAEVRARLDAADAAGFPERARAHLSGKIWKRRGKGARRRLDEPLAQLGTTALERAWHGAAAHGDSIAQMPEADRHALRKDLKALRYLAEFFGPAFPAADRDAFLRKMKTLQDALGVLNDLAVARAHGAAQTSAKDDAKAMAKADRAWRKLVALGGWW